MFKLRTKQVWHYYRKLHLINMIVIKCQLNDLNYVHTNTGGLR